MISLKLLKEAAGGIQDNSHTDHIPYDAAEYVKCIFFLLRTGAQNQGTHVAGGMHSGSAKKEYKGGSGSTVSTFSTTTDANRIMMYNPTKEIEASPTLRKLVNTAKSTGNGKAIPKSTKSIKTFDLPKFPNNATMKSSEGARDKYIMSHPYVQSIIADNPGMAEYVENYYTAEPSNDKFMPYGEGEIGIMLNYNTYLRTTANSDETSSQALSILRSKFVSGSDRDVLALSVDKFKDLMTSTFNKRLDMKSDISMDNWNMSPEEFADILNSGDLDVGKKNLADILPDNLKSQVNVIANNSTRFNLSDDLLSIVYLGSVVINRANNINTINANASVNERLAVFAILNPDNPKSIDSNMRLAVSILPKEIYSRLKPNTVYSIYMSDEIISLLTHDNLEGHGMITPKTFGTRDDYFYAIDLDPSIINIIVNNPEKFLNTDPGMKQIKKKPSPVTPPEPVSMFESKFFWLNGW